MTMGPEQFDEERLRQAKVRLALDELRHSEEDAEQRRRLYSRAFGIGVTAAVVASVFGWYAPLHAGK